MSVINKEIRPFKSMAYDGGMFVDLAQASMRGKWTIFLGPPGNGCNNEWREP